MNWAEDTMPADREIKPLTWLGSRDSAYSDKILARLATKTPTEITLHSAFRINICTFLAVVLCNFGLDIVAASIYVSVAYVMIALNVWRQLYVCKIFPGEKNTSIVTELIEDSAIAVALPINVLAEQAADPIIALGLVMAALSLQTVISIKPFNGFVLSKTSLFLISIVYLLLVEHNYSSSAAVLFPMMVLFVLLLCVGYWLYVRQVRLMHLTFEQHHLQQVLAEKNQDLARSNELRERIIRHIGHDLRQPISSISYAVFNMKFGPLNSSQQEQLDIASRSIDSANYLIEEILKISSNEDSRAVFVYKQEFDIGQILDDLGKEFRSVIQKSNGSLNIVRSSHLIYSDYQIVERILRNFLSNAARYSKGSKVLLGVRRRKMSLEIQVIDRGPGMPKALLDVACEEFTRGNQVDKQCGLGLGLNIAKNLACSIGGEVCVSSTLNLGTACSLRIPVEESTFR